ncbi:hypothetical protein BU14_1674s0002 [Porphyra umbilicalis]|uniref:Uncharacterized protein n=1 Tax=Porphyra umbilicalis TaxID=2786 RepID=A0A1X6NKZ3_PORUM|nr:hypothetical protein BU14_1674s0002 [Porphyra umbilicalis]|eukprot:OSX69275.1 hypothetical protein BU14_1674s0002 [Porphyra umbilicalis]
MNMCTCLTLSYLQRTCPLPVRTTTAVAARTAGDASRSAPNQAGLWLAQLRPAASQVVAPSPPRRLLCHTNDHLPLRVSAGMQVKRRPHPLRRHGERPRRINDRP